MADKYWWPSGGTGTSTGNWSSTTNWSSSSASYVSTTAPTSADNANFGSYSGSGPFTVTVDTGAVCLSFLCANSFMTLAGTAAWSIYGNFSITSLSSRTYTGAITFAATTTGWTIGTSVTFANAITFSGSGGGWTLTTALINTSSITFSGTNSFNSSSYNITCSAWIAVAGTTPTFGTTLLTITGTSGTTLAGASKTYYAVTISSGYASTTITGNNTYTNFTLASRTSASEYTLAAGVTTQTITGTFSCASPSLPPYRNQISGGTWVINGTAGTIDGVDFLNTTFSGTASPISPTNAGNCGGNTGINFPAARTLYFVAGTVWGGTTSAAWATSSGGAATVYIPVAQDTAIIDNSSPSSISFNSSNGAYQGICNIDATLRTTAFTLNLGPVSNAFVSYGDFKLSTAVTSVISGTPSLSFKKANANVQLPLSTNAYGHLTFTGGINATGNILVSSTASYTMTVTGGLALNGFTLTNGTGLVTINGTTGSLNLGGGTINCYGSMSVASTMTTTGSGTINMNGASAKSFSGASVNYSGITLNQGGAGALTISGSNTFNNITNSVQPCTVTFTASTTQTVANFGLTGTAGNLVTINSSTAGTQATLSKTSGTVSCDYLSIQDSKAQGGAGWYAGANSTNVSGNTGWNFTVPPAGSTANFFFMFS